MDIKNSARLAILTFFLFLACSFLSGCFAEAGHEENAAKSSEINYGVWVLCANDLNDLMDVSSGQFGLNIEQEGEGCKVYLGSELDKCLDLICENFATATNQEKTITSEQVRVLLTDDFQNTVEEYRSDNWESSYIYNLFKWCGTSCRDTAVYYGGVGFNDELCKRALEKGSTINYDVIINQVSSKERNEEPAYKFKWQ